MSSVTVKWSSLDEYREVLRQLPEACAGEAAHVVEGEANAAYVSVATVYGQHQFTGTLRRMLTLSPLGKGTLHPGKTLRSGSPIAWLFDNGSQARHWASGKSTGQMWGRTPPTHIFAKSAGRARRRIINALKDMLLRRGASTVTGE